MASSMAMAAVFSFTSSDAKSMTALSMNEIEALSASERICLFDYTGWSWCWGDNCYTSFNQGNHNKCNGVTYITVP